MLSKKNPPITNEMIDFFMNRPPFMLNLYLRIRLWL
jgi:hypothetical protein